MVVDRGRSQSYDLVRMYLIAALVWLLLGMLAGALQAYRLTSPGAATLWELVSWLNYGRSRMFHTHAMIFGWLTNAFFAFSFFAVPHLCGQSLFLPKLHRFTFVLTQIALALGAFGISFGFAEGVEYAEAPWWADIPFALAFVLNGLTFVVPIFLAGLKDVYVSLWYLVLAYGFTALNFVMSNTIVAHVAPGAAGAALAGLWIHNAVGLWITPMGSAIVYYMLPALLKKPIASHKLSLLGFWTLAFFYPLGGSHHYFFSPVPWWLQVMAVPLTSVLIFVVYTVVYNFFATMRGEWHRISENISLRFLVFGIFSYVTTCTQGPFQAFLSVQKVVHFTDWVVAHAHLALFGVFSWWTYSFIYFVWPIVSGRSLRSRALSEAHFWLSVLGFYFLYYIPDTMAGLLQGFSWLRGLPFVDSLVVSQPFWLPRAISGVVLIASVLIFVVNLAGPRVQGRVES